METKYREFCEKYKEKLRLDKDIEENPYPHMGVFSDLRDRITFQVSVYATCPGMFRSYNNESLFALDEEDLEYLYNKYSKLLKEEMNSKIDKIKKKYNDSV